MRIKFKIIQLEKLGKKQNLFIVSKVEKYSRVEITSKIYGATSLVNCKKFIKIMIKQLENEC